MDEKEKTITEKVAKLYLEYGIKSITMDDVARHLTISKKTLYQFFKDKKELVWAVLEHNSCENKMDLSILENQSSNAIDDLFNFYDSQVEMIKNHKPAFVYDLKKYYPEIFSHFQKIKHKRILESIINNLIKGKKEGLYRSDINEDIISRLSLMRIEGIMNSNIFSVQEIVSPDLFSEIFKYNLFGLVSDKGRKLLNQKFRQINISLK
ncbi:MAG: TetR/AcrR family transcriptional regulator [Bacteroidota bacterium]